MLNFGIMNENMENGHTLHCFGYCGYCFGHTLPCFGYCGYCFGHTLHYFGPSMVLCTYTILNKRVSSRVSYLIFHVSQLPFSN